MTRIAFLLGSLLCCTSLFAQEASQLETEELAQFRVLFNGENLDGWDGDPRLWSVKDGVIHGETTAENVAKGNTFLIMQNGDQDGILKDFELRLSFRCNATNNSGVQYRSERLKDASNNWVVKGYQHEIRNENTFPNISGFIYDEKGTRKRITTVGQKIEWTKENERKVVDDTLVNQEEFKALMKIDDWNDVTIIAKGNHMKHYLNGKLIMEFIDNDPKRALSEGVLALQLHAGKPMWAEFKDLKIREIE